MRLIDADALIEDIDGDLNDGIAEGIAIEKIMNAPTIEERKKGKWIKQPYINGTWEITCSNCMRLGMIGSGKGFNYCPNCGARMEVGHDA